MPILGTCVLFITFPPGGQIVGTQVRVVDGLPFGLILGAASMRQRSSALIFKGAEWFQPSPSSVRVPWQVSRSEATERSDAPEQEPVGAVSKREDDDACIRSKAAIGPFFAKVAKSAAKHRAQARRTWIKIRARGGRHRNILILNQQQPARAKRKHHARQAVSMRWTGWWSSLTTRRER